MRCVICTTLKNSLSFLFTLVQIMQRFRVYQAVHPVPGLPLLREAAG